MDLPRHIQEGLLGRHFMKSDKMARRHQRRLTRRKDNQRTPTNRGSTKTHSRGPPGTSFSEAVIFDDMTTRRGVIWDFGTPRLKDTCTTARRVTHISDPNFGPSFVCVLVRACVCSCVRVHARTCLRCASSPVPLA